MSTPDDGQNFAPPPPAGRTPGAGPTRCSSITSSIFFRSRTAATPNRSLMLMMPRPADLHVVLDDRVARAVDGARLAAGDVHDVVGHQPVPAHHQVQGDFALADAALAQQQDAHAEHVHQHAVQAAGLGERLLEEGLHLLDEGGWRAAGSSSAPGPPPRTPSTSARGELQVLGDHHAGQVLLEELRRAPRAAAPRGGCAGRRSRCCRRPAPAAGWRCSVKPVSARPGFWMREELMCGVCSPRSPGHQGELEVVVAVLEELGNAD